MRYRAKVDANQAEVVDALRRAGASVTSLAAIGKGCPDLLVGFRGRNYLFEVKSAIGRLTPDQEAFALGWQGGYQIVRSVEEALYHVGLGCGPVPRKKGLTRRAKPRRLAG